LSHLSISDLTFADCFSFNIFTISFYHQQILKLPRVPRPQARMVKLPLPS
jgi:hypothetical protein